MRGIIPECPQRDLASKPIFKSLRIAERERKKENPARSRSVERARSCHASATRENTREQGETVGGAQTEGKIMPCNAMRGSGRMGRKPGVTAPQHMHGHALFSSLPTLRSTVSVSPPKHTIVLTNG